MRWIDEVVKGKEPLTALFFNTANVRIFITLLYVSRLFLA